MIEITRTVCNRHPAFWDIVIEPAHYAFADGHYREVLAYLLGDYVNAIRKVENVVELIPTLMFHHTMNLGIPIHRPSEGAIHALRAIANVDLESVLRVIETNPTKGDKESRLEACDSLDFLLEDHPELADRVFEPLLRSLEWEESMYERSADIETLILLARMASQNLARLSVVEAFYERASVDVKALIFRFYRELAERTDNEDVQSQCAAKAIHLLAAGIDNIELLESCASFLVQFGRIRPVILAKHLDSLIGALALVATRPAEIREHKSSDVLESMNQMGLAAQWDRVVNEVEDAIEEVGKKRPESVAPVLQQTIVNTSSKTNGAFKSRLISILGKISGEHLVVAQAAMPLLFGLLMDMDSTAVRGNAVQAFGDIAMHRGDILPADVVELMKEMLRHETYTYVIMKLVYAFRYISMPSVEYANSVCGALAGWENSFESSWQKEG